MMSSAHIAAIIAFSLWGLFPVYWKWFEEVPAIELFAQRLMWSFLTLLLFILAKKKFPLMKQLWSNTKTRYWLILAAILISSNWLLYIYAVSTHQVLEASMGYFLNPIINVLFGWIFLKESMRKTQWPAVFLALFALVWIIIQSNIAQFPWIALTLSITFALYGLIRKLVHVGSLEGLAFETGIVFPFFLIYWFGFYEKPHHLIPIHDWRMIFLALSGLITCIPLMLFAYAAKRLPLRTLGFIQYLSPSLKFVCGWYFFHEPLSSSRLQAFSLIWVALAWYTLESIWTQRHHIRGKIAR